MIGVILLCGFGPNGGFSPSDLRKTRTLVPTGSVPCPCPPPCCSCFSCPCWAHVPQGTHWVSFFNPPSFFSARRLITMCLCCRFTITLRRHSPWPGGSFRARDFFPSRRFPCLYDSDFVSGLLGRKTLNNSPLFKQVGAPGFFPPYAVPPSL